MISYELTIHVLLIPSLLQRGQGVDRVLDSSCYKLHTLCFQLVPQQYIIRRPPAMYPLNDFNLICCAIATVSAAVGYRYSRRLERIPMISR